MSPSEPAPALSVLDLVPVSAGRTRREALADTLRLARVAEDAGFRRYWLAEHHGSATFLAAATTVLMGQVLAATERLGVASGGVMLPNHPPLLVAEQIGTLASLYPGRVTMGVGRAPGTDRRTARALRRREADPRHFAQEVVELLDYFRSEPDAPERVPGSMLVSRQAPVDEPGGVAGSRVRAVPAEGMDVDPWVLGSSVHGARVASVLGLPFAVASHFAPAQAEAAIMTYRSGFDALSPTASGHQPRVAASVNAVVAQSKEEADYLFSTAMMTSARIIGGLPAPLDPPSRDPQAWRQLASGREDAVEQAMRLSFVGTPDDVAARLHELAERWGLEEVLVVTYVHDPAARRRSYELLGQAW